MLSRPQSALGSRTLTLPQAQGATKSASLSEVERNTYMREFTFYKSVCIYNIQSLRHIVNSKVWFSLSMKHAVFLLVTIHDILLVSVCC